MSVEHGERCGCRECLIKGNWSTGRTGSELAAPSGYATLREWYEVPDTKDEEIRALSVCIGTITRHLENDPQAKSRLAYYLVSRYGLVGHIDGGQL